MARMIASKSVMNKGNLIFSYEDKNLEKRYRKLMNFIILPGTIIVLIVVTAILWADSSHEGDPARFWFPPFYALITFLLWGFFPKRRDLKLHEYGIEVIMDQIFPFSMFPNPSFLAFSEVKQMKIRKDGYLDFDGFVIGNTGHEKQIINIYHWYKSTFGVIQLPKN